MDLPRESKRSPFIILKTLVTASSIILGIFLAIQLLFLALNTSRCLGPDASCSVLIFLVNGVVFICLLFFAIIPLAAAFVVALFFYKKRVTAGLIFLAPAVATILYATVLYTFFGGPMEEHSFPLGVAYVRSYLIPYVGLIGLAHIIFAGMFYKKWRG